MANMILHANDGNVDTMSSQFAFLNYKIYQAKIIGHRINKINVEKRE